MEKTALMQLYTETPRKLVWKNVSGPVPFSLYIPKWRVPEPVPREILVRVGMRFSVVPSPVFKRGCLQGTSVPIQVRVHRVCENVNSVRFAPRGTTYDREIGEPYIPFDSLPCWNAQALCIEVQWL